MPLGEEERVRVYDSCCSYLSNVPRLGVPVVRHLTLGVLTLKKMSLLTELRDPSPESGCHAKVDLSATDITQHA